jgi:hypothetical protein
MLGKLVSIIGAATGLVLIYFIPLIVNIVYYRLKHPTGEQRDLLINRADDSIKTPFSDILNGPHIISEKPPSEFKDIMFYVSQFVLMLFGTFTLLIQFVKINFFGVELS